ncbi:19637_t:CDS:2 [Gigaspora margarita]|uniref:19637_t:CDS:1 n=1 Tax=Gigaspora margarita TaxID=4874 RepID=A0ABN7VIX9_GIGMA|nr:19637_t:CDS:2 [Gigaspora margarita]
MIENQEQKKQLDTLARLLTGISKNKKDKRERDKSVAVCYHEGKLFVASNKKKPEYAKEYLEDLQKFANNPSSSNYENLLKRAARKIHNEQNSESVLQKFQEKARECEESQQPD